MKPFAELTYRGQVRRLRELAQAALRRFGVRRAILRFLHHAENTTFRVDQGSRARYLLRLHRPGYQTPAKIRSELAWMRALRRDTDVTLPEPVAALNGRYVVTVGADGVPDARACSLLSWIDGRIGGRAGSPARLRAVGRLTAVLHDHTERWRPPRGFVRTRWEGDALYGSRELWRLLPAQYAPVFRAAARRARALTRRLGPKDFGLIHADLHLWNIVFRDDEACPIDFDDTGFAPWLYDAAVTLGAYRARPDWPRYRDAYWAGYAELRPIPPRHVQRGDVLIAARDASVAVWITGRAQDNPMFRARLAWLLAYYAKSVRALIPKGARRRAR